MDTRLHAQLKERNSLWYWLITVLLFIAGLLFVLSTEIQFVIDKPWLKTLLGSVGGAIVAAAAVSLIWELIGKRKFADELFTIADISQSAKDAGILEITHHFYNLPWEKLFEEAKSISVFIAYGRTWRNTSRTLILKFLSKPKNRLTPLLPDPSDKAGMLDLARRFSIDETDMIRRISEAIDEFKQLEIEAGAKEGTRLKLMLVSHMTPTATYYLFDNAAIITTYPHSAEKRTVPAFLVGKGGNLYEYVEAEIGSILKASVPYEKTKANGTAGNSE